MMNDNSKIWSNILSKIKLELTSVSYDTWFEETKLYELKNGIAKIIVPYAMSKDHLANNYKDFLKSKFIEEIGDNVEFEFIIEEELDNYNEEENQQENSNNDNIYMILNK